MSSIEEQLWQHWPHWALEEGKTDLREILPIAGIRPQANHYLLTLCHWEHETKQCNSNKNSYMMCFSWSIRFNGIVVSLKPVRVNTLTSPKYFVHLF